MQYRRRDLGSRCSRSAGALGCHTRIRAGFPRDGSRTVFYRSAGACPPRSPLASYVFRSYGSEENQRRFSVARAMARDRPSPYGEVPFFSVARGPSDAIRASERVSPRALDCVNDGEGQVLPPHYDEAGLSAALLHRDREVSPTWIYETPSIKENHR